MAGSRRTTWGASTYDGSRRSTATTGGCARGSPRCWSALRGPVAQPRARDRPTAADLAPARAARGAAVRCSGPGWAGSGRSSSAPDEPGLRLGAAALAGRLGRRATGLPHGGGASSTRRRSRSTSSQGPDALAAPAVALRRGRRRPGRRLRLHPVPQRPRRLRGRPDRHPDRRRRLPAGLELGDHGPRPRLDQAAERRGGCRGARDRRHRPVRRARGDGSALARVCWPRSRRADLSEEGFPFATSREVRVADRVVRATRMTYVGEPGLELLVPVADAVAVYDALGRQVRRTDWSTRGTPPSSRCALEKGYRRLRAGS